MIKTTSNQRHFCCMLLVRIIYWSILRKEKNSWRRTIVNNMLWFRVFSHRRWKLKKRFLDFILTFSFPLKLLFDLIFSRNQRNKLQRRIKIKDQLKEKKQISRKYERQWPVCRKKRNPFLVLVENPLFSSALMPRVISTTLLSCKFQLIPLV